MRLGKINFVLGAFFLTACEAPDLNVLKSNPFGSISDSLTSLSSKKEAIAQPPMPLPDALQGASITIDTNQGFAKAIKAAVVSDPAVLSCIEDYKVRRDAASITRSQKDMQFSGTVYGGIADVTDETAGLALVLSANKLMYDGGQVDSRISAETSAAKAAFENYKLAVEESAFNAASVWGDLEQYQHLNNLISTRLEVLDPLIDQLEKVAAAGVGDVTMVAAAQRTVSLIRVTEMDVQERLEQSRLAFINVFGSLPNSAKYEYSRVSSAIPKKISEDSILRAPAIQAGYASYNSAFSNLSAVEAKDNFSIGFETRFQRPFGGSGYDSDEAVGFVVRKTLFGNEKLGVEIAQAKSRAEAELQKLRNTYRTGRKAVESAYSTIEAMDKAILLAKNNAENLREEIDYLKKQLIIGQSTLDSVLSAEARLYDVESKEINFIGEKRKAELTVLASLGLLSEVFNIKLQ